MRQLLFILTMSFSLTTWAQNANQTIRGTVTDEFSNRPLSGALVSVAEQGNKTVVTDADGAYEIKGVPLGRRNLKVSLMGYNPVEVANLMLNSGKEAVVDIHMKEKVTQLKEVVVNKKANDGHALNEMATISARAFSVEQTERFAGSLGDPARMVANYAGVMAGNDSRNDIVIRGNSPLGVLWRLEGVEIPNPNHFGAQGTTGGAVSMLNSNLLSNSDFLTGAFPAEFGNALSGVFDLNLRSGNNSKYEFTGQVGFNGFEAAAEGPIKLGKNNPKGSFIADYRFSTLDLVNKMGFSTGTGAAIPEYQDFTMLIDLPTRKAGRFKLMTMLGKSMIRLGRTFDTSVGVAHSDFGTATDFGANLAFTALTHQYFFSEKTGLKTSLSYNKSSSSTVFDTVDYARKSYYTVYNGTLGEQKYTLSSQLKHRISNQDFLTGGFVLDFFDTNFSDSSWVRKYNKRLSVREVQNAYSQLLKAYTSYQHTFSNQLLINAGLNYQYYTLSQESSIEPRFSLNWQLENGQSFNLGFGQHSQIQSRIIYYSKKYDETTNTYAENNRTIKASKAQHYIAGYEKLLMKGLKIKAEAYYQHLYNVPVSRSNQQFSMLNQGSDYFIAYQDSLVNSGKGKNYGLELTLEKLLDQGYYFLLTASIFDSKYQGYDHVWRNTAFNTNYVFNLLGGYEWKLGKNNFLTFDLKTVWTGGRRRSPIDLVKSRYEGTTMYDETHAFESKYRDYFRTDFRIGYKLNGKKITQEWAVDLQNISNHQNIYSESFNPYNNVVAMTYQQGFTPMMLYRINF